VQFLTYFTNSRFQAPAFRLWPRRL